MFWTITPRPPIVPRSRNRIAAGGLFRYGQPNRCFARRRCRSGRGAGPAFRRDARALARPRGVAVRRRCERAVDARRIACQMASRAHELVLRNLRAARPCARLSPVRRRSEEHTSELQSLMRISYDVFCLKKKKQKKTK